MITKTNIHTAFQKISNYWDPMVVGELNGQQVKLALFHGAFHAHRHETEDEMFLVIKGSLDMELPDQTMHLEEGDMVIIPHGTLHKPVAVDEARVLLFEPNTTRKEGDG